MLRSFPGRGDERHIGMAGNSGRYKASG